MTRGCELLLAWPDGARRLIGTDGMTIHIEPTVYSGGITAAMFAIDAGMHESKVVSMPVRDPASIPKPAPKQRQVARQGRISAALTLIATGLLIYAFVRSANAWTPQDGESAEKAILLLLFLSGVGCVRLMWLAVRRIGRGHW